MEKTFEHVDYSNVTDNTEKSSNLLTYEEIDDRIKNKNKKEDLIDKMLDTMTDKKLANVNIKIKDYEKYLVYEDDLTTE